MSTSAVLDREQQAVVRVLPLPRSEPPSDDEWSRAAAEPPASTAVPLPLRLRPTPTRRRATARAAEGAYAVDPAQSSAFEARADGYGEVAVGLDDVGGGPDPSQPPPALPEVRQATIRFVATFLEVTAGYRPIAHLRQYCRPDRFERISDHLRGRPGTRTPPTLRGAAAFTGQAVIVGRTVAGPPPRTGRAAQRSPGDRLSLRRVQICQVSDTVAEVVAVLARRGASAAMAFRMEKVQDRWLCAHLEII
jgi:hypothetical protein